MPKSSAMAKRPSFVVLRELAQAESLLRQATTPMARALLSQQVFDLEQELDRVIAQEHPTA